MAEAFQTLDVVAGQTLGLEAIEKVSTQIGVSRSCFEHMIEDHQDRMAHGNLSAFPPAVTRQAAILRGQVTILRAARRPGGLRQASL